MSNTIQKWLYCGSIAALSLNVSNPAMADDFGKFVSEGKVYGAFNLRSESVEQNNALKDADALTLRSRLGVKSGEVSGFSALLEWEDSRTIGVDDYNDTNGEGAGYSVIADPESSEMDQALIQFKNESVTAKLGRQVLTMDNHRFVGHVGWRQDRQTFDALSFSYKASKDLTLNYAYIDQRNRIFADEKDLDAKDHLINASYKLPAGTLTGYAYLLEVDEGVDNSLDTYGLRFSGATMQGDTKLLYSVEYATQESETASSDFDADYMMIEGGAVISGITAKLGYEVLGSDSGSYGFSTPLATLHKFNGWADQFLGTPAQGLADLYLTLSGKAFGGKWTVVYHDFEADDASATVDDLGDELDISYVMKFAKRYTAGIKYAAYDAGDIKVDTDKLWVWLGASF